MPLINHSHSLRSFLITLCLGLCLTVPAWADALNSDDSLELLNAWQETPVTTARIPRPPSKVAENITVITAADIERLNAHTLAEVLQTVPGIQLDYLRTPTTYTFFNLQGAYNTTVLVLVDGIRLNTYQLGIAPPGLIPIQQIERIEILKGPASTAWGSALGGVINIITKSPNLEHKASGMVSGSIGSQFTADSRAELSGTLDKFGYYLTVGNIRSDGLNPGTATNLNNINGKLTYSLPGDGIVTAGLWHLNTNPGMDLGDLAKYGGPFGDSQKIRRTNSFIKLTQPLGNGLRLELDGYLSNYYERLFSWYANDNERDHLINKENSRGINTRLSWGDGQRNLTIGLDYGHVSSKYRYYGGGDSWGSADLVINEGNWDQWGLYANGAYTIGNLTLLPGIRHDITGRVGDNTSYSLGATYQLMPDFTLRGYATSGYSLTTIFADDSKPQKVKTIQAGFETSRIPYLWLKGTYFYNAIRHSESVGINPTVTDQNRQGFEVELRTVPLYGFSVASGYTYLDARDNDTDLRLPSNSNQSVPPHNVKLKLNYDNSELGFSGTLTGNYIWWNKEPGLWYSMSDSGMLWDLHLNWKPFRKHELAPEFFFSGHNLFNGSQSTGVEIYNSAPRWFEGGMRVRF